MTDDQTSKVNKHNALRQVACVKPLAGCTSYFTGCNRRTVNSRSYVVRPASHLTPAVATSGLRLGRCRLRRPQMNRCRCRFQNPVTSSTARQTSSQVANRRPFNASNFGTFYHGSIRFRYVAYTGWKTNSREAEGADRRAVALPQG